MELGSGPAARPVQYVQLVWSRTSWLSEPDQFGRFAIGVMCCPHKWPHIQCRVSFSEVLDVVLNLEPLFLRMGCKEHL